MQLNANFIKKQLKDWNVSKSRLAKVLHTNYRTVDRWLNTKSMPRSTYLIQMTIVLDCEVEDLIILESIDEMELL